MNKIKNFKLNTLENTVLISINPKIYSMPTIMLTSNDFVDNFFLIVDGDPETEIFIEIKPKHNNSLINIGEKFNNKLIEYSIFLKNTLEHQKLRESLSSLAYENKK